MVVFSPLTKVHLRSIVELQLGSISRRLADRGIRLVLEESGLEFILANEYDPAFGARPLRRFLEKSVGTHLSRMLIRDEVPDGSEIHIEAGGTELKYQVVKGTIKFSRPKSEKNESGYYDNTEDMNVDDDM